MNSLVIEARTAAVQDVTVTDDALMVDLMDGRTISIPLAWYPRLLHGQPQERNNWRLIGQGRAFTGPISMKTSAQRISSSGSRRARVNGHSAVGCRHVRHHNKRLRNTSQPDWAA